jgi:hypothetical protein
MIKYIPHIWLSNAEHILVFGVLIGMASFLVRTVSAVFISNSTEQVPVIPFSPPEYFRQGAAFRDAAQRGLAMGRVGSIAWTFDLVLSLALLAMFAVWVISDTGA